MVASPNEPEEDFNLLDYLHIGPIRYLEVLIKLPGLFVVQYVFFWNWKRIVDPHSWEVILTGLGAWAIVTLIAVLVVQLG